MRISDWSSDVCSSDLFASPFGVAGLGIAPRRRALDDRAELIGAAREFEVGLQKLDARARVDGEHALGLEHAQRVAQWLHRNAEQADKIILRDKGARGPLRSEDDTSELQSLMRN